MPNARAIGRNAEYDIRDDINKYLPDEDCKRQIMSGALDGLKGDLISKSLLIEVKRRLSLNVNKNHMIKDWLLKIVEEERNTAGERIPVLIMKEFRGIKVAVLELETFLELIRIAKDR
jgi:hypothetical protein